MLCDNCKAKIKVRKESKNPNEVKTGEGAYQAWNRLSNGGRLFTKEQFAKLNPKKIGITNGELSNKIVLHVGDKLNVPTAPIKKGATKLDLSSRHARKISKDCTSGRSQGMVGEGKGGWEGICEIDKME